MPEDKKIKITITKNRIAIMLVALVIYTMTVLIVSDISFGQVVFKSEQPTNINYKSHDPYEIVIEKGPRKWNSLGFPRMHQLRITSKGILYGIYIRSDIYIEDTKNIKAEWRDEGLKIVFSKGYELFISKDNFTGGR